MRAQRSASRDPLKCHPLGRLFLLTVLLAGWACLSSSAGAADVGDVEEILRVAPSRNMGSPYREAIDRYIAERFKATGFECGQITFPTAIYVPGETELRLENGAVFSLHSMSPNVVHPGNLPEKEWSGLLVDAGNGATDASAPLNGSAVLLDMDSGQAWLRALEVGAKVLIFAGQEVENARQGVGKIVRAPLSAPRFYLTHADSVKLRQALGAARNGKVTIVQKRPAAWKYGTARDDWVIVPGSDHADQVVHIQAYKDANSFVPDFSPGAQSAANLALLLRLLDYYQKNPPDCTLVFSAVSDHCNYMRGEEFYLGSLFHDPTALKDELEQRHRDIEEAEFYAQVYSDPSPEQLARLRSEAATTASGRKLLLKAPLFQHLTYLRNRDRHQLSLLNDQIAQEQPGAQKAALLQQEAEVRKELDDIIAIMAILQRWGVNVNYADLSPERQAQVLAYMREIEAQFNVRAQDARSEWAEIEANGRLKTLLEGKTTLLYLTLDLTFGAERMGFFVHGGDTSHYSSVFTDAVAPLARRALDLAAEMPDGRRFFVDALLNTTGVLWRNYLGDRFSMASALGNDVVVSSVTLATTGDTRDLVFTPSDTLENLPADRTALMMDFAARFLTTLLDQKGFATGFRPALASNYAVLTLRYNLRRMDPYAVEIPTEPAPNAAVVAWLAEGQKPVLGQVSTFEVALTDRQGGALFRALPLPACVEAYGFNPETGAIDTVIDAGAGTRRLSPLLQKARPQWVWDDHIALVFDCVQTDLVGLYDPATREAIPASADPSIILLDGRTGSSPDHYGIAGIWEDRTAFRPALADEGLACLFTEEGMPLKVVSPKLLLINSSPKEPDGVGYMPGDGRLRMISYTAARDIQLLNGVRKARIEGKGVSNPGAETLYRRAKSLMTEAEIAREEHHERRFLEKAIEGLSYALRSYVMVRTTTTDLVKAVALFLALVIPFCMFLTQLIIPSTDIRLQIGAFVFLFGAVAFCLALLHPAFSLSQTPMMVLLAFVMVGLAFFVMLILFSRFDAGLNKLVEETQGVESQESSRKTLAGVAFSVGVSNMRRRRIRTSLTAATIVLVTFTMLSVISVGQSVSAYQRKTDRRSPYNGVLYARPGLAPISESEMEHAAALLSPFGQVVKRTWTQRLDENGGYMPLTVTDPHKPGQTLRTNTLLGVQKAEDGFVARMPLAAGRWFSADDAREIILSVEGASYLGISKDAFAPCDLLLQNDRMRLVGLIEDAPMRDLCDLAKLPVLPLESVPNPVNRRVSETGEVPASLVDATAGPAPASRPVPARNCALVPIQFALSLPDTRYRTVAMKAPDAATAWEAAQNFVGATSAVSAVSSLTYTGLTEEVRLDSGSAVRPGEYSLGSPVGASIGGVSKVVIPICLAAAIILNTMLGTVMERKREIAVYNSIGLNPTHVFEFFVAEALVFGVIGSVAGYLVGQGAGRAIIYFHWLPGVVPNFSSMAVMVVILAAIATVILSTLYPAFVATRAAVPSGQRRWKLPAPQGDVVTLDFPFSYGEDQLPGVFAFLSAFMDLNSEVSSGQFLAQDERFGTVRDREGRKVLAMVYNVTPVPFDLGVNQRMEFYGYYQPHVRAYMLGVTVTRTKGDKASWLRVNQPLMESFRSRLLNWRSQSPARQKQFRVQGQKIFAQAQAFPTQGSDSR